MIAISSAHLRQTGVERDPEKFKANLFQRPTTSPPTPLQLFDETAKQINQHSRDSEISSSPNLQLPNGDAFSDGFVSFSSTSKEKPPFNSKIKDIYQRGRLLTDSGLSSQQQTDLNQQLDDKVLSLERSKEFEEKKKEVNKLLEDLQHEHNGPEVKAAAEKVDLNKLTDQIVEEANNNPEKVHRMKILEKLDDLQQQAAAIKNFIRESSNLQAENAKAQRTEEVAKEEQEAVDRMGRKLEAIKTKGEVDDAEIEILAHDKEEKPTEPEGLKEHAEEEAKKEADLDKKLKDTAQAEEEMLEEGNDEPPGGSEIDPLDDDETASIAMQLDAAEHKGKNKAEAFKAEFKLLTRELNKQAALNAKMEQAEDQKNELIEEGSAESSESVQDLGKAERLLELGNQENRQSREELQEAEEDQEAEEEQPDQEKENAKSDNCIVPEGDNDSSEVTAQAHTLSKNMADPEDDDISYDDSNQSDLDGSDDSSFAAKPGQVVSFTAITRRHLQHVEDNPHKINRKHQEEETHEMKVHKKISKEVSGAQEDHEDHKDQEAYGKGDEDCDNNQENKGEAVNSREKEIRQNLSESEKLSEIGGLEAREGRAGAMDAGLRAAEAKGLADRLGESAQKMSSYGAAVQEAAARTLETLEGMTEGDKKAFEGKEEEIKAIQDKSDKLSERARKFESDLPRELRLANAIALEAENQAKKGLGAQREANCELSHENAEEKALANETGESPKQIAHPCGDECGDECDKPCDYKDEPPIPDANDFMDERSRMKAPRELLDEVDPC